MKRNWIVGFALCIGLLAGCAGLNAQMNKEVSTETSSETQEPTAASLETQETTTASTEGQQPTETSSDAPKLTTELANSRSNATEDVTEDGSEESVETHSTPAVETGVAHESEYETIYEPILKENLDVIKNGYDPDKEYQYLSDALIDKVIYEKKELVLQEVGYAIEDISGDSVPELLIGIDGIYNGKQEASGAFGIFTYKDGEVVNVIEGWDGNAFIYLGDGHFHHTGSSDAMYSGFGVLHLSPDGTEIIWDDYYFTSDKDGGEDIFFFHNTTGESDINTSEELSVSLEDFLGFMLDYEFVLIPWKPFGN